MQVFNFHPRTFKLPTDLEELKEWHSTRPVRPDGQPWTYIIKPCANMQGKGIRLSQVVIDPCQTLCTEYSGESP